MAHIVFFEKPGCGGNARQRTALEAAGHTLERCNLLTAHWTRPSLLAFLAPLLAEPLLIRRPLMQRADNDSRHVGFDTAAVDAWVGLGTNPASTQSKLEGCAAPTERCAIPT